VASVSSGVSAAPASTTKTSGPGGALAVWFLIVLGVPVYVFRSGLPQPADLALVLFLGIAALRFASKLEPTSAAMARRLYLYVGVVGAVNAFWFLTTGFDRSFAFSAAFAVFNSIVFIGFLSFSALDAERVLRTTALAAAAGLLFQAVLAIVRPDLNNGTRLVLLFNNPNQLAYYCLGAATVVLLVNAVVKPKLNRWIVVGAVAAGGFVTYLTYSRSALGGYVMLCCVPFIRRPRLVLMAALPIALAGFLADNPMSDDPLWQRRIEEAESQQLGDYMEDRGVDRLVNNPQYLLFGSGEGAHDRFNPFGLELHSSFAGILFYYGAVGLAVFASFMFSLVRGFPVSLVAYLAPTLIYSFFHNGMRFRIFWLLLAVVAVIQACLTDQRPEPNSTEDS